MPRIFILLLLFPALANPSDFRCKISEVMDIQENGKLQDNSEKILSLGNIGEEFVVDGTTGRIIGSQLLINSDWGTPRVLRPGADNDHLLILTVNTTNHEVYVLDVAVWMPNMPFIYFSSVWGVTTGVCSRVNY